MRSLYILSHVPTDVFNSHIKTVESRNQFIRKLLTQLQLRLLPVFSINTMKMRAILFLVTFCTSANYCRILPSLGNPNGFDQLVRPRIVSIVDELQELGRHPQTVCPFEVEKKTEENDHPHGNVVVAINELVCSGACKNENCSGTGSSCKQMITTLRVSIRNPATGLPEKVISTNVAAGCSCTPQDAGALGEDVLRA